MMKILNTIWILVLAVAMCGFGDKAYSISEEVDSAVVFDSSYQSAVETSQKNFLADAELGGVTSTNLTVWLRGHHTNTNKEALHACKIEKRLSLSYDNVLAKHSLKHAGSTVPLNITYSCEYYVFALRELLI